MIAYLDASVLLRVVLQEANPLREWNDIVIGITSELTRVETARVIDRLVHLGVLQDEEIQQKYAEVGDILRRVDFVPLDEQVLLRASRRLPTVLGTLDAIHLASAQIYRESQRITEPPIVFATHDHALAKAAVAMQFQVIGI